MTSRRVCPICAGSKCGRVAADCGLCRGLGALMLGATAKDDPDAGCHAIAMHVKRQTAGLVGPLLTARLRAVRTELEERGILRTLEIMRAHPSANMEEDDTPLATIIDLEERRAQRTEREIS